MNGAQHSHIQFRCPVCKKAVARDAEDFPFCSERCRIIDLGCWASEEYRVAGDPVHIDHDMDSE